MSGRYPSPSNPFEDFETACLKVYYPDKPSFFRALMGQVAELESRYIWDVDGDILAANRLQTVWITHGEMTRAGQKQGCIEQSQLDELNDYIEELENMNITVQSNGCCPDVDVDLELPDGTPLPTVNIPINPDDIFGEQPNQWDDSGQVPPDGWPDYQAWDDARCALANYTVDAWVEYAEKLDTAENNASVILDIVSVLLLIVPVPFLKTKGFLTVAKWVAKLLAFLNLTEEYLDYVQIMADFIDENREDLVCFMYAASDTGSIASYWYSLWEIFGNGDARITGLAQGVRDALDDFIQTYISDFALTFADYVASKYIPVDYVPTVDCQTCVQNPAPLGYEYIPMVFNSILTYGEGTGTSNAGHTVIADGLEFSFDANAAGRAITPSIVVDVPPDRPIDRYRGYRFTLEAVTNCANARWASFRAWDGAVTEVIAGEYHFLREQNTYPDPLAGMDGLYTGIDVNPNTCLPDNLIAGLAIGTRALAAGNVVFRVKNMEWIVEYAALC